MIKKVWQVSVIVCLLLAAVAWSVDRAVFYLGKPDFIRDFESAQDHKSALTELLAHMKKLNEEGQGQALQEYVSAVYLYAHEDTRFDLNDAERLCSALKRYGQLVLYVDCLQTGLTGAQADIPKTRIRLSRRLIREWEREAAQDRTIIDMVHHGYTGLKYRLLFDHDIGSIHSILEDLNGIAADQLDEQDRLTILSLNLKYESRVNASLSALMELAHQAENPVVAGKAYFIVGRHHIDHDQCPEAISVFNQYIDRSHDGTGDAKFIQKAFQRILYCQTQLGMDVSDELKDKILTVITTGGDLSAYFELSRHFYDRGDYATARSLFSTGIQRFDAQAPGKAIDFKKIKASTSLIRSALLFEDTHAKAEDVIRQTEKDTAYGNLIVQSKDAELTYIYTQFLLWTYHYHESEGDYVTARHFLLKLIALFENSKDFDYAVAQLALLCKKAGCTAQEEFSVVIPSADNGSLSKVSIGGFSSFVDKMSDSTWKSKVKEWMSNS